MKTQIVGPSFPGSAQEVDVASASARSVRYGLDGRLYLDNSSLFLQDSVEGSTVDSNKWVQTTTTMTIGQASGAITLNSGSSALASKGAMLQSHHFYPYIPNVGLMARFRAQPTATQANTIHEMGFGNPSGDHAAAIADGAVWRKQSDGSWIPVLSIGGTEVLGNSISNAIFTAAIAVGAYAFFEVQIEGGRAKFAIYNSNPSGALGLASPSNPASKVPAKIESSLVPGSSQVIDIPTTQTAFQSTHLRALARTYNQGSAPASAVQLILAGVFVAAVNSVGLNRRPYDLVQSAMGYNALTDPTAFTQLANYSNTAAPSSATLSNTAAGYTTLGGQWQFAAVGGAETDYALFAYQVPSPFSMVVRGIRISSLVTGAANATTATILQWGLGFNSSAVSLATGGTYPYMRKAIGTQVCAITAAINTQFTNDIDVRFAIPYVCQPGRFFAVILKIPVGTATASEVIRGTCDIDATFE